MRVWKLWTDKGKESEYLLVRSYFGGGWDVMMLKSGEWTDGWLEKGGNGPGGGRIGEKGIGNKIRRGGGEYFLRDNK